MRPRCALLVVAVCLAAAGTAAAEESRPLRLAVVVGNDLGYSTRQPLRFAEDDARKVRDALVSVGGFAAGDVTLLAGGSAADLATAFDAAAGRIAGSAGQPALLLFYFSGHADGSALELGDDLVQFAHVRERLEASGATLRIALVDACLSGQMVGLKGVRQAPGFDIDVAGDLNAEGTVVLTSTSGDEMAQENAELGGAVFTHHLVSGLLGAADEDGDLLVSLRELYRYTYGRTLGATAASIAGPQHPAYGFELEGKGDVVLGMLSQGSALLRIPAHLPGDYFVLTASRSVVAQLLQDGARERVLALAPGRYSLLRRTGDALESGSLDLAAGQELRIAAADLSPTSMTVAELRGIRPASSSSVVALYSLSGWLMPEMGTLHSAGLLLRHRLSILDLQVRATYGLTTVNDNGFQYDLSLFEVAAAALIAIPLGRVSVLVGPMIGAAQLSQDSVEQGEWTGASHSPRTWTSGATCRSTCRGSWTCCCSRGTVRLPPRLPPGPRSALDTLFEHARRARRSCWLEAWGLRLGAWACPSHDREGVGQLGPGIGTAACTAFEAWMTWRRK